MEHTFTVENFQNEVLGSSTPVLVDFWAEWCPPCRVMSPMIEELAGEIDPSKMKLGKLNVDQNGAISQQYGVLSIPTFIIFKDGQVVDQFMGSMPKEVFKEKLMKHM